MLPTCSLCANMCVFVLEDGMSWASYTMGSRWW